MIKVHRVQYTGKRSILETQAEGGCAERCAKWIFAVIRGMKHGKKEEGNYFRTARAGGPQEPRHRRATTRPAGGRSRAPCPYAAQAKRRAAYGQGKGRRGGHSPGASDSTRAKRGGESEAEGARHGRDGAECGGWDRAVTQAACPRREPETERGPLGGALSTALGEAAARSRVQCRRLCGR